jgi:4-carboxymuconolactone decarboxylase
MTRIPALGRDDMNADQQAIHDRIVGDNGRVGFGPAIGYAYSAGVWDVHNRSSAHLLDCSLTPAQVRIVSLMTVRHWNAAYPWSAQAKTALKAGLDPAVIEAINSGEQPDFDDDADAAVHAAARELLATGTLSDDGFKAAEAALGYVRTVEVVGAIGHFCATAMMANLVGVTPAADAPSHLKTE